MTRNPFFPRSWLAASLGLAFSTLLITRADAPRVLPAGELPQDRRLGALKDLDGYFPFQPSANREAWADRAERVRRQVLVALGLWPLPERTPLHAVIHGRVDRPDYTVEKVFFESHPGFFVTGNLYRPKGRAGRVPGVLCPHGHWTNGRFYDCGLEAVRQEIANGAERFEDGGRNPLQSRCVQLARMGCVVFHYDMIGYADCQQISQSLAHGFAKQRPEMNTAENWGLFSPQAEAHLQSVMGLQTWNSIRALDFLTELPDVDPQRLGVTGASGGGTQTFILGAVDPRPAVAFPAVMVSTAMQGGCTCENASLLRVDTGNVELAALFAPKPLGMTAADDWTKEMPTKGFPELKQHFQMLGAANNVMLKPLLHFGHNYNYVSRAAMYAWFNQHLKLGLKGPMVETDYPRLTGKELTVWDDQHPKPDGGPEFERQLLRNLTTDFERQFAQLQQSVSEYRRVVGGAAQVLIGRSLTEIGPVEFQLKKETVQTGYTERLGLLRNPAQGEELPVVILNPARSSGRVALWLSGQGKASLFASTVPGSSDARSGRTTASVPADIRRLLEAGYAVIGADLLYQGEFLADGKPLQKTGKVKNPREAAAYTFGYNPSLFAQRVRDILSLIQFVRTQPLKVASLTLVGVEGAGPWAAAALTVTGSAVDCAALDTGGFRFGRVLDLHDVNFLPGGAKYGDLPGLLALYSAQRALGHERNDNWKLWLAGEGAQAPALVQSMFRTANAESRLECASERGPAARAAAVAWLCRNPSPVRGVMSIAPPRP